MPINEELAKKIATGISIDGATATISEDSFYSNAPIKKDAIGKLRAYEGDYVVATAHAFANTVKDMPDRGEACTMHFSMGENVNGVHTAIKAGDEWKVNTDVEREIDCEGLLDICHKRIIDAANG
jgi:hypothetical protein